MLRSALTVLACCCAAAGCSGVLGIQDPQLAPDGGATSDATLIHHYTFATDASDAVGGANGTLHGSAHVMNDALILNGTTDYVEFATHIVPTSGSYSVALRATQTGNAGSTVEMISQGRSLGPGFYLGHDSSGVIRATDNWNNTGAQFPSDGQPHAYALVIDTAMNQSRLYLDGTRVATSTALPATTTGGTNTRLGQQFDSYTELFAGSLADVRIYSSALSDADVAQIAAGP